LWCAIEDRLIPALRLSTHERAIYYHLIRRTHLRGALAVRVSRRTLGRATGLNVNTARHYLGVLAQKQCIGFVDRGVRGCLVRVRLPEEILARMRRSVGAASRRPPSSRPSTVSNLEPPASKLQHRDRAWPRRYDHKREALRKRIFSRERGRCFYCRRKLPAEWTLDHVTPPIRGGRTDDPANLVACCAVCNAEKGLLPAPEFLRLLAARAVLSPKQLRSRLKALRGLRPVRVP
jgi:5-methylcytosine-specific restriction endonuclease McrA